MLWSVVLQLTLLRSGQFCFALRVRRGSRRLQPSQDAYLILRSILPSTTWRSYNLVMSGYGRGTFCGSASAGVAQGFMVTIPGGVCVLSPLYVHAVVRWNLHTCVGFRRWNGNLPGHHHFTILTDHKRWSVCFVRLGCRLTQVNVYE